MTQLDAFFGFDRSMDDAAVQLPIDPWQEVGDGSPTWVDAISDAGFARGSFEGLCNEPDMETPFAYAYAGRADRVQEVVTAVKTYSFAAGRGGLAGNDDSGGEAAWFVWASIGLFPVTGQPVYIIGSPSFARVDVRLGGGVLVVRREGIGAFIQSGTLAGVDLGGRAWLWVDEAHAVGNRSLVLTMGPDPPEGRGGDGGDGVMWGSVPPPSFKV